MSESSIKMLVILEAKETREYHCYQHDIQFQSEAAYTSHVEWCETFLEAKNLCTYVYESGYMCAEEFRHVASLLAHSIEDHGVYLCVHCKKKFTSAADLELHDHTTVQAHESRKTVCFFGYMLF